jgi:hypothetical protein
MLEEDPEKRFDVAQTLEHLTTPDNDRAPQTPRYDETQLNLLNENLS